MKTFYIGLIFGCDSMNEESPIWFHCMKQNVKECTWRGAEFFANCTDLKKVYPNGVPAEHPAYQLKMDRDNDNYACEN